MASVFDALLLTLPIDEVFSLMFKLINEEESISLLKPQQLTMN